METPAPMVNDILTNAACLPLHFTHQSVATSNPSLPVLLYCELVAELCRIFCS